MVDLADIRKRQNWERKVFRAISVAGDDEDVTIQAGALKELLYKRMVEADLASSILLSIVSRSGRLPEEQDARECARCARNMLAEIAEATERPKDEASDAPTHESVFGRDAWPSITGR